MLDFLTPIRSFCVKLVGLVENCQPLIILLMEDLPVNRTPTSLHAVRQRLFFFFFCKSYIKDVERQTFAKKEKGFLYITRLV
jgi:hypothetical protein